MACPCCLPAEVKSGWYSRFFAYVLAHGMARYEAAVAPVKHQLFAQLLAGSEQPVILDMGVGAGPNLKYIAELSSAAKVATCVKHGLGSAPVGSETQMVPPLVVCSP
jgi:hypothetical protein